jgi:hypothetical protein
MSFTAKAAHLVVTCQARDFTEACSILGRQRRAKKRPTPTQAAAANTQYWWQE